MHYYQFNIGDYKSHTSHLTIYEDIAYRRLLDLYYLNEKPIPSNAQDAARLIGMKDRYPDVECVLQEFFTPTEQGWINKRADKEIAVYKGFSDAGKRGAAKRWGTDGNSHPITPPIANNNHKPLTNNQELKDIKPLSEYSDEFEQFWKAYPKKTGKGGAYTSWKKQKPKIQDVLQALSWQTIQPDWTKENGQFIPMPTTYINQRRWEDESKTPKLDSALQCPKGFPFSEWMKASQQEKIDICRRNNG